MRSAIRKQASTSNHRETRAIGRACHAVIVVLLAACARVTPPAESVRPQESGQVIVVVENANWSDVAIHIVHGGTPRRIGNVGSMRTAEITIPRAYITGASDIVLAVTPLGTSERYVLPAIMVYPGATVRLQAARTLGFSTLALREGRL